MPPAQVPPVLQIFGGGQAGPSTPDRSDCGRSFFASDGHVGEPCGGWRVILVDAGGERSGTRSGAWMPADRLRGARPRFCFNLLFFNGQILEKEMRIHRFSL